MTAVLEPSPLHRPDIHGRSWEGSRVTVVGLGRSGLAAAELLCRIGAKVRVTELRGGETLQQVKTLLARWGVEEVETGTHSRRMIADADLVVVSPGVPESSPPLRWAMEQGVPILSEIELAFAFCPSPVVGVTGTNGKSTTVTLIAAALNASGQDAIACGNLGNPFSSVLPRLTPETVAVVEVSSFQLLWCDQFRPKIGVLLNIGTNHLDRHQDPHAYLAAKARLFARQTPADWAVLNGRDSNVVSASRSFHARRVWFGENRSNPPALHLAPETLSVLTDNAQAVLQVARLLDIPDPLTWQVIRAFRGLEHRLERVATLRGVHFVNDSKSTTPASTLYALEQVRGQVVLILGGRDKGLDFAPLLERLHDARVSGVVLIGESRERLRASLNGSTTVRECGTLAEAVQAADALAAPGTTVLFSPACASFDMFQDFEDRGRQFKSCIDQLAEGRRPKAEGPWVGLRPPASGLQPTR